MSDSNKRIEENTIIITEKVTPDSVTPLSEPYLIQISGRETGQTYHITVGALKLGRDPACAIALDDPHVSRLHAELSRTPAGGVVLRDIGSTNGVFVNGTRITEQSLSEGDKVLIGTRLYFKFTYQDAVDQKYQQDLFAAANKDALTQLYNKKYFLDVIAKEFSFSLRDRQPLSLLMIDIDHFKQVNDTHGHLAGDQVLKTVGQIFLKNIRLENVACRYGGEEFAVILRNVSAGLAQTVAERLRAAVEQAVVDLDGKKLNVTISVGIATCLDDNFKTFEELIHQADQYLYKAKADGRNRIVTSRSYP